MKNLFITKSNIHARTAETLSCIQHSHGRPTEQGRPLYFPPVVSTFIFFSSFIFLAKCQRSQTGRLPYFYTWCGLSANLGCRSEMCCTRLAGNTGRKNDAKDRHLGTMAQLCRAVSSQLRHVWTIGKNLLSSNIFAICPYNMVNFSPLTAKIGSGVWVTLQISTGFAS